MKKRLKLEEAEIEEEIRKMDEIEYGLKELVHGILIGIVIGFVLSWFLLN